MTDTSWADLENSTIRLGSMHTSLQIAIEHLGNADRMTTDLLALIRDSLGDEIGRIEKIHDELAKCRRARRLEAVE